METETGMRDDARGQVMADRLGMNYVASDHLRDCRRHATFFRSNYARHLPADRASSILDVGCGRGHFLWFCRDQGYRGCRGIDLSRENVDFCNSQGFSAEQAEAQDFLDVNVGGFDCIVANDVIEHIPKAELFRFVDSLRAALTPGGVLIVKTINAANPITGAHGRYLDITHETAWTEESMRQVLEFRGFRDVRVLPSNLFVFYRNPLNYVGLVVSKSMELFFRLCFRLYGRNLTTVFTKNLMAVAKRGSEPGA